MIISEKQIILLMSLSRDFVTMLALKTEAKHLDISRGIDELLYEYNTLIKEIQDQQSEELKVIE